MIENEYKWEIPVTQTVKPSRPFKAKIPFLMHFLDQANRVFIWNKNICEFQYYCTIFTEN
jgi:hypothetical protein